MVSTLYRVRIYIKRNDIQTATAHSPPTPATHNISTAYHHANVCACIRAILLTFVHARVGAARHRCGAAAARRQRGNCVAARSGGAAAGRSGEAVAARRQRGGAAAVLWGASVKHGGISFGK